MPRVYLETSFISACVTDRTDAASIYRRDASLEWWNTQRHAHEVVISEEVVLELSASPFHRSQEALAFVQTLPRLAVDQEVIGVAEVFVRERVMPGPETSGDAMHVALAAVYAFDYILSWNVRHLANPRKAAHLAAVCRRIGLAPPSIVTPDLLWESP